MKDSQQTFIAGTGAVYLGEVGADFEQDPDEPVGDELSEIGYLTTDGLGFNDSPEYLDVESWQSPRRIRRKRQSIVTTVTCSLQQWNNENLVLAHNGGEFVDEGGGLIRFDPPDVEDDLPEYLLVVDVQDGERKSRYAFYDVGNDGGIDTSFQRSSESVLPVTFEVLEFEDGPKPWNFWSNDPSFDPTPGS